MKFAKPAGLAALCAAMLIAACSDNDNDKPTVDLSALDHASAERCDHLVAEHCLYPFPNNYYTVADANTDTGLRVNLQAESVPAAQPVTLPPIPGMLPNGFQSPGGPFDPTEWNRNDGFSPGSMLLAYVPGLDLDATGAVRIGDVEKSLAPDAPILVIDAESGERQLIWAELDAQAQSDGDRALIIRPAKNFIEGRRYIVALRALKDADGKAIEPTALFRAYRDRIDTGHAVYEARRAAMNDIFDQLAKTNIVRSELYLAWDFTVASQRNLTERLRHVRDEAFALLGGGVPDFTVTDVQNAPASQISRRIDGTFKVPNFLNRAGGSTGSRFNYADTEDRDALPQRNGSDFVTASFRCQIANKTVADFTDPESIVTPARASLYGHGLLGNGISEVNAGNVRAMSDEHNVMFCATHWIGMANDDRDGGTVFGLLSNVSQMPALPDRSQQGFLAFMYLAELMRHPEGFATDPAFNHGDVAVFDGSEVFFDGNSQGGILGGAMVAVAPNVNRAVLGVPGANYSLLLQRNNGFPTSFAPFMYPAYPSALDQQLVFALQQMLWDRAENNGYLSHYAGRHFPDATPQDKKLLLHVALGDHQVTQWSAEIMARNIGARMHQPTKSLGESPDENPYYAIDTIANYPYAGHALMVWDSGDYDGSKGTPFPPSNNTPPLVGDDPHESPRATSAARVQKSEFLKHEGAVVDVCGTAPCHSDDHTGRSRID